MIGGDYLQLRWGSYTLLQTFKELVLAIELFVNVKNHFVGHVTRSDEVRLLQMTEVHAQVLEGNRLLLNPHHDRLYLPQGLIHDCKQYVFTLKGKVGLGIDIPWQVRLAHLTHKLKGLLCIWAVVVESFRHYIVPLEAASKTGLVIRVNGLVWGLAGQLVLTVSLWIGFVLSMELKELRHQPHEHLWGVSINEHQKNILIEQMD